MTQAERLRVLVLGAGRNGQGIARMLADHPRFAPHLVSLDGDALADVQRQGFPAIIPVHEVTRAGLPRMIGAADAMILTQSAFSPPDVVKAAQEAGCIYLDILESPHSAARLRELVRDDGPAVVPGCGLAPGYVTALAAEALRSCGPDAEVTVFVGVLPQHPTNRLGYADIWGVDGLIDEYTQPCAAIESGVPVMLPPLHGEERLEIDGQSYEAFRTAGSLDGLIATHAGQVRGLVFKTLRYPGHLDYMRFLLDDLGLSSRIYQLRSLLMTSLEKSAQDRVVIALRVLPVPGASARWQTHVTTATTDAAGRLHSASGLATAAHVCAMLDVLTQGPGVATGWVAPGAILPDVLRQSSFFDLLSADRLNRGATQDDQTKGDVGIGA